MKTSILFKVVNLIGLLVICHQLCISQTIYSGLQIPYDPCSPCTGIVPYGNTTYFNQPQQVASDFGPRYLDDGFHGGVDFNCYQEAGDAQKRRPCVSPQAGVFPDFDKMTVGTSKGYKYGLAGVQILPDPI